MHTYLAVKDALNLALCNWELARDVHSFSSAVQCGKKAEFVSKVLSKRVSRPVVMHYQEEEGIYAPKKEGDLPYM
jgi:hypothetical protein